MIRVILYDAIDDVYHSDIALGEFFMGGPTFNKDQLLTGLEVMVLWGTNFKYTIFAHSPLTPQGSDKATKLRK